MTKLILGEIDITTLKTAQAALSEAIVAAETQLEKDGAIQRFEYTYELLWKTLRRVLAHKGKICNSPRNVFRESAAEGLLEDPVFWFSVMEKRNLTTHTYNLVVAEEIFQALPEINEAIAKVIKNIEAL